MKQKYVIYKNPRMANTQELNCDKEWYFSGEFMPDGRPRRTERFSLAYHFDTAKAAYDFAFDVEALHEWKVGARPRYE